ncbi:Crp/Fnr family transcriptional regulator [Thiolapillus sp.]|uniref:Crp/Fnr family transcriptional regulator n=1 Tax=Thiolapillus sp. TaxID=2017437 RepID=UPI0026013D42
MDRVVQRAKRISLVDGEALFQQGDTATRFYLVVEGHMKLFRLAPDGNEKVIELVDTGHTFAEALMFLEQPRYPVGAVALGDTELISVDVADFSAILRDSVDLCLALLGDMSFRLRSLIREIDDLSLHSATCRVAAFILARAPADCDDFDLEIPKHVIASRISVKPETFSRIIKSLKSKNVLEIKGSKVHLLDREALEDAADVCGLPVEVT